MWRTFWSCLIRCVNMKWMRQVLLKIQSGQILSTDGQTDGRTDGQMDRWTGWNQYTPVLTLLKWEYNYTYTDHTLLTYVWTHIFLNRNSSNIINGDIKESYTGMILCICLWRRRHNVTSDHSCQIQKPNLPSSGPMTLTRQSQCSRLRRPISKIRTILLIDAKIWMVSLIIMLAVHPISPQDAIFKMSSVSPESLWLQIFQRSWCKLVKMYSNIWHNST